MHRFQKKGFTRLKLTANVSNVRRASVETKEEYKQKVEDELERSASQVEEWEGRIGEADPQTRAQREEQLEALRHIQDIARSEMERLEEAEGEAWHDVKARLDGVLSELRSALSNASNKFF
jgi:broad specificity phosphatase PhoE